MLLVDFQGMKEAWLEVHADNETRESGVARYSVKQPFRRFDNVAGFVDLTIIFFGEIEKATSNPSHEVVIPVLVQGFGLFPLVPLLVPCYPLAIPNK